MVSSVPLSRSLPIQCAVCYGYVEERSTVIIRRFLFVLLCVLPFLLIALVVFVGAYAILKGVGDIDGATLVWRLAMFDLMLTIIDLVLMIPTLALFCLWNFGPGESSFKK